MKKTRTKPPKTAQLCQIVRRLNKIDERIERLEFLAIGKMPGIRHINPWRKD